MQSVLSKQEAAVSPASLQPKWSFWVAFSYCFLFINSLWEWIISRTFTFRAVDVGQWSPEAMAERLITYTVQWGQNSQKKNYYGVPWGQKAPGVASVGEAYSARPHIVSTTLHVQE